MKKPYQQTFRNRHGQYQTTRTWYIDVYVGSRRRRIGGFATEEAAAECLKDQEALRKHLESSYVRRPLTGRRWLRYEDLAGLVLDDYAMMQRPPQSVANLRVRLWHLRKFFGGDFVEQITGDRVARFIVGMQKLGYANGSINVIVAALKRGFALAVRARLLRPDDVPFMPHLAEHNARKGFFERSDFETLLAHVPEYLEAFFWCCYLTGWRPKSEMLTREWKHVDFAGGWLRLDPGETKNLDGREFPLIPDLRAALERQRARCDEMERRLGRIIPWVFFTAAGKRVTHYQIAWDAARRSAGMPNRIVYDLRRTAVRNLERADVPRSAAMAFVGHRTQAMYQRYAIVDSRMLQEAGAKLQQFTEAQKTQAPVVVPFTRES